MPSSVLDARNTIVNERDKGPIHVKPYTLLEIGSKPTRTHSTSGLESTVKNCKAGQRGRK